MLFVAAFALVLELLAIGHVESEANGDGIQIFPGPCPHLRPQLEYNLSRHIGDWYVAWLSVNVNFTFQCGKLRSERVGDNDVNITANFLVNGTVISSSHLDVMDKQIPGQFTFDGNPNITELVLETDYDNYEVFYQCYHMGNDKHGEAGTFSVRDPNKICELKSTFINSMRYLRRLGLRLQLFPLDASTHTCKLFNNRYN